MAEHIPIKLAEAALEAQAKALASQPALTVHLSPEALDAKSIHLKSNSTDESQQYISKATFDEVWMLNQQTKAELAVWRDAAIGLAELADRAFFYSREERADADLIIKTIRKLKQ